MRFRKGELYTSNLDLISLKAPDIIAASPLKAAEWTSAWLKCAEMQFKKAPIPALYHESWTTYRDLQTVVNFYIFVHFVKTLCFDWSKCNLIWQFQALCGFERLSNNVFSNLNIFVLSGMKNRWRNMESLIAISSVPDYFCMVMPDVQGLLNNSCGLLEVVK